MAVWQKGSGLYFVARFMKGVHGLTRLKLGSKAQGEQGYLKTSQLFWASGTGGTSCQKSPSRASALLFFALSVMSVLAWLRIEIR
jgi:hypothetical protein